MLWSESACNPYRLQLPYVQCRDNCAITLVRLFFFFKFGWSVSIIPNFNGRSTFFKVVSQINSAMNSLLVLNLRHDKKPTIMMKNISMIDGPTPRQLRNLYLRDNKGENLTSHRCSMSLRGFKRDQISASSSFRCIFSLVLSQTCESVPSLPSLL